MQRLIFILFFSFSSLFAMAKREGQPVSETIGVTTLYYQDAKRNRPVTVELWYPAEGTSLALTPPSEEDVWVHPKESRDAPILSGAASRPLIIMSHGHRGDRRERSWLADALVREGFIVAAVDHFGNTWHHYTPLVSLKFWERAKDISFALDHLVKEPSLKGKINPEKIGFVGYSLGGMTGLGLAGAQAQNTKQIVYAQQSHIKEVPLEEIAKIDFAEAEGSFQEPRISSMFLICPATFVFPSDSLQKISIPIGMVAAINDEVLPHKEHAYRIIKHISPQKLKLMRKEISHYAFLNRLSDMGQKILRKGKNIDPPCCDRTQVHREVALFAIEFFNETLQKR